MSTGSSADFPAAVPALDAPASRPNGGQGPSPSVQGLDLWVENFRKYEATLVRLSLFRW